MTIWFILLAVAAYLLGSVPAANLAAKWSRGIDLRNFGTGNVGGSNLVKATSFKVAVPVFIYDFLKGAGPVWLAQAIGLEPYAQIIVGICAVIGHNWPIFQNFQGGRGILTSEAVILAISPLLGIIILVTAYAFAPFKMLSLGVFIAFMSLPLWSWLAADWLGIEDRTAITLGFLVLVAIGFLRRLSVPRAPLSQSVPTTNLIINRLLLDRDIRDRKAWINQRPAPGQNEGTEEAA